MAESLTPEQHALADRIESALAQATAAEVRQIAELLARKSYGELLGQTEFEVRDLVHRIGAKAVETALIERKKGATSAAATAVRTAAKPPNSNAGKRKPS